MAVEALAEREQHDTSARLYERARRVMPGGNTRTTVYLPPYPPYAARGEGYRLIDADGRERIDLLNNYTALIHGHADPDITAAVVAQLQHGTAFAMPTEHEVALAELLCERVDSLERVRFTNSGTEAVMMAVRAARAYTGRSKIAKVEGCYHGAYDVVEVSLAPAPDTWGTEEPRAVPAAAGTPQSVLDEVVVLRFNDVVLAERLIKRHRHELAAVLVDPAPMRAGLVPAEPAFLERLRQLCDTYGIVLIFDEVIAFRTGPGGTQARYGVRPDLTTLGKIIGGGFPVGAVGGSAEVMDVFDPSGGPPRLPHGGTFNANPMTMVAGLAAMRKLTPAAYERLNAFGAALREGLAEALDGARIPGQVTGIGSLFQVHLHDRPIRDYRSSLPTPEESARTRALHTALLERGLFLSPSLMGCLSTPMDEPAIGACIDTFSAALRDVTV